MAKNTFAFIGILAVLLMSIGMVSASTSGIRLHPATFSTSINHGSSESFTFLIENYHTEILTNITLESEVFDLISISDIILASNISLTNLPNTINPNSNSTAVTVTLNIPEYQSEGEYVGTIKIDGDYETDSATAKSLNLQITIPSSPELTIELTDNLTKTENGTIKVENTGNVNLSRIDLVPTTSADFTVKFNESDFDLDAGHSIFIDVSSIDIGNLNFRDDSSLDVKATNGSLYSNPVTLSVTNSFYDGENQGNLKVSIDRINVEKGFGDDEEYWYPLDEIELKIEVENNGNLDVENIELKICLFDEVRGNCVFDEDDMDIEDEEFDLDSGDDKNILVTFNVDPNDLRKGNTDYTLYVSAVGKIDDYDSQYNNDETGDSISKEIEIRTDEEFVILDEIILTDLSNFLNEGETSCGNEVKMTAKVWNVGDKDLDNDEVFVQIYNKELGINKVISFNNGIDSMDWESLETTITIPSDVKEKTYSIKFTVYDDENLADKDIYDNREEDEAEFYQFLKVINCKSSIPEPTIIASLDSEAKVGEELIITATITNNGEDNEFVISITGFEDWAELISIEPQTLSIDENDAGIVLIKLIPTKEGFQTLKINAIVDGETYDQSVSVNIAEKEKEEEGFLAGVKNNIMLYSVSAGIVAILILIFLTFIVKISRKSRKVEQF